MHVLVRARLGLYARKTWLRAPVRVGNGHVRARLGLYARKTWMYAPKRVCTCPSMPVRTGNLAVRILTCVYVPVRAYLGLYHQ